jgi:tripartite-type tricarboxylate transporter receptor subunit TctC
MLGIATALVTSLVTSAVLAQTKPYPNRPIFLVSGHAVGTGGDVIARYIGKRLSEVSGQPVIVENKPGAYTMMAIQQVSKAAPDGYTLHINAGNGYAMNPALFKEVSYDPNKSLQPIATLMRLPFAIAVGTKSPYQTIDELTKHLKENGKKSTYGYSSNMGEVAASLYNSRIGADPVGVAYKGSPDALNDLNAGNIEYLLTDAPFLISQARQGNIRVLAVTTAKRSSSAPEITSLQEAGIENYDLGAWWGVWAPIGTPPDVIVKLEGWFKEIVSGEDARKFIAGLTAEPFVSTSDEMKTYLAREVTTWDTLVKGAGIQKQ